MSDVKTGTTLTDTVQEKYGAIARQVTEQKTDAACCGPSCCGGAQDPISKDLYSDKETASLPGDAVKASLGCGNPTALAELRAGETVLDLGSGGGIDVLLSARRVGPAGKAYGLDMTDDMLALARKNQREAGVTNGDRGRGSDVGGSDAAASAPKPPTSDDLGDRQLAITFTHQALSP